MRIDRENSGRSPHGERGLKYERVRKQQYPQTSLSSRRAWIEIPVKQETTRRCMGRSPHGERGLKYGVAVRGAELVLSLSSRGAWIEIRRQFDRWLAEAVALLTESVD